MYKILVVDDEPDVCETCSNFLSRRGYTVDMALSGQEALDKIKTNPPDIVLLDITMPGMGGIEVLKRIKEVDTYITVIMVTATEDAKVSSETLRLGASGYITKPVNANTLESLIKVTRKMDDTKREIDSENEFDIK